VLSIATWVTPYPPSQSRNASSSAVVVPNVRTCCSRTLVRPGTRTHATTVFLWTSNPQQRSITRSMAAPPRRSAPAPAGASCSRLCSACSMATMRGPGSSHVNFGADSRYQTSSTWPGVGAAGMIAGFHGAGWAAGPSPFWRRTSLEIDDQLELGRLLNGEIGGLSALQDLVQVDRSTPLHLGCIYSIGHESTWLNK